MGNINTIVMGLCTTVNGQHLTMDDRQCDSLKENT